MIDKIIPKELVKFFINSFAHIHLCIHIVYMYIYILCIYIFFNEIDFKS